jgi:hypothetical protein
MNSRRLLDAIEKTQQDLEELKQHLAEISKDRDEFAVFSFQSRRSFRYNLEHGRKSGKNVEVSVRMSYKEAQTRGFQGSIDQWRTFYRWAGRRLLSIPLLQPTGANRTFWGLLQVK